MAKRNGTKTMTHEPSKPHSGGSLQTFVRTRMFGAGFAFITLLFLLFYVFALTQYQNYLVSDMGAFWMRAMERLNGNPFDLTQYWTWPPGYHIFLAELFRFFRWLGLESLIRLETALSINILLYALSVYAMQRVACRWFDKPQWIVVLLFLYGFGFTAWYFNSFLLSGNLAIPLLVTSVALMYCLSGWKSLVLAAVLFAIASIVRPSIAPYGLAFVIFYFIRERFSLRFIARAAVFSTIFFALIFGAGLEISRISQGKVTGLSANGGLDFFIANSNYHRIDLNYKGKHNCIIVPALADNPENGFFRTNIPYFKQNHYFKMGWEFIKHDPTLLVKNIVHIKDLFYGPMMPCLPVPGARTFFTAWNVFKILMALSLGLYIWLWRGLPSGKRTFFGFLISVFGLTLLVSYLFTGEPRYTYQIIFVFYLLFLNLIEQMSSEWQRWKKVLPPYALVVALGTGAVAATVYLMKPDYPPTIIMQTQAQPPQEQVIRPVEHNVGRFFFPYVYFGTTKHADTRHELKIPTRVSARTTMVITGDKPLPLKFDIYSDWAYEIRINDKLFISENPGALRKFAKKFDPNTYVEFDEDGIIADPDADGAEANADADAETDFEEFAATAADPEAYIKRYAHATPDPDLCIEQNAYASLKPGRYTVDIVLEYIPRRGGFSINYNYFDDKHWKHRHMLGVSDDRVKFMLPRATDFANRASPRS